MGGSSYGSLNNSLCVNWSDNTIGNMVNSFYSGKTNTWKNLNSKCFLKKQFLDHLKAISW